MSNIADRLVNWIRQKVSEAEALGVVCGLSGGVDSSTTALLCKKAFPESSLFLIMPCHSNSQDKEDALKLVRKFNLAYREINLEKTYDHLVEVLPNDALDAFTRQKALANIKPRLRMIALYYFANRLTYLVAGTGNKSELTVGYFTKYGDGGADILPLGNLVKEQVRGLAKELGVPEEIILKTPTAGLWDDQEDEKEIGLTYRVLDNYISTGQADETEKEKIEFMKKVSEHKRRLPEIPPF